MLDYFLSSDWAIIATELLAGFIVISLILAILVWRGQRRHTGAAERLLDDRDPIMRASEEMLDRQIQRTWPELAFDEEQRESYAERSLDAVEAMVEPWLEPKRYELAAVARRFLQVRQADLDQLLTLARAQAEKSEGDDDQRLAELEKDIEELRDQRDRQAKHLAESLDTVNVMVREYGRKFDYNDEPRVATVLKAIVMVQEMDAGADCETAKSRADEVFTEDLVATPAPAPSDDNAESSSTADGSQDVMSDQPADATDTDAKTDTDADTPTLSAEDEMAAAMAAEGVSNEKTDAMEAASKAREDQATATAAADAQTTAVSETADDTDEQVTERVSDQAPGARVEEQAEEPATKPATEQDDTVADTEDLDQLIEATAKAQTKAEAETPETPLAGETTRPDEAGTPGAEEKVAQPSGEEQPPQQDTSRSSPDVEQKVLSSTESDESEEQAKDTESPEMTESRQDERREQGQDEGENGVIDLDDVEIPREDEKDKEDGKDQEFDLDDIDALLDAEIARKHGKDGA